MIETTKDIFWANGEYSQERLPIHAQIINELLEGKSAKEAPTSILMGGGSASGKSTVAKLVVSGFHHSNEGVVYIDPDTIKEKLPEFERLLIERPSEASDILHDESSDIAQNVLEVCVNQKLNFIYDGTMKNLPKYEALITQLKDNGYSVNIIVVDVPVEEALKREMDRRIIEKEKGRFVPEEKIIESHSKVAEVFFKLKNIADAYTVFDNTGSEPRIIAQKTDNMEFFLDENRIREFFKKAGIILTNLV